MKQKLEQYLKILYSSLYMPVKGCRKGKESKGVKIFSKKFLDSKIESHITFLFLDGIPNYLGPI